ncbi:MAG: hypothetical protein KDA17_04725, partial [Candidatus Saccharibacteria bacterium]|nr:hypothetical protein [Candidatus Saccharibacteria bacterium]
LSTRCPRTAEWVSGRERTYRHQCPTTSRHYRAPIRPSSVAGWAVASTTDERQDTQEYNGVLLGVTLDYGVLFSTFYCGFFITSTGVKVDSWTIYEQANHTFFTKKVPKKHLP